MEIEIDRPLIDARNIRAAATQDVAGDDVADPALIHNDRPTLLVTLVGVGVDHRQGDTVQAIQDGDHVGQQLRIKVVDEGTNSSLIIVDDNVTARTILRGDWRSSLTESATTYQTYIDLEWDGTYWHEIERYDGVNWRATGVASHAEGLGTLASGTRSHAENDTSIASGYGTHAEGGATIADGTFSHSRGQCSFADLWGESAQAGGQFAEEGDAQFSRVLFRSIAAGTTDDTLTELYIDGVDDLLTILDEYTYACTITVCGRQDTGADNFMGVYHALVQRTGGAPALVGAVDSYENNPGGFGGADPPVVILAGATNLEVWVEGLAGHNIRWVATVEMTRVGFEN